MTRFELSLSINSVGDLKVMIGEAYAAQLLSYSQQQSKRPLKKRLLKRFRQAVFPKITVRKNKELPAEEFNRVEFNVCGYKFDCRHYETQEPQEMLIFITGCHAKTAHFPDNIRDWASKGRDVCVVNLRIPPRAWGFTLLNLEMIRFILTSEQSPALRIAQEKNIPIKVQAHSYGAQLLTHHMRSPDFVTRMKENGIKGALMMCPFYSAPGLDFNRIVGRIKRPFFFAAANRTPYDRPSETIAGTWIDIINHRFRREPYIFSSNGMPALGQVIEMQKHGDMLRRKVNEHGFPSETTSFPTIIIGGKWDKLSGQKAISNVADSMNANCILYDGWHTPMRTHPKLIEECLDALNLPSQEQILSFKPRLENLTHIPANYATPLERLPSDRTLQAC